MNSVFADTFYWAALTNIGDPAHVKAIEMSGSHAPDRIVTTEEVLVEYLAFFASARPRIRDRAGQIVAELLDESSGCESRRKATVPFLQGSNCTARVRTKGTAWLIAFRCTPCARKGSPTR